MRKFIITASCLFILLSCSTEVFAQYKFFTGGTLKFLSTTNSASDIKSNAYAISPYIGAAVSDNILVGLAVGYEGLRNETNSDNYTQNNNLVITPFARYRVTPSDKMGLYGELGANIRSGTSIVSALGVETDSKTSGFGVYLGPGLDYAFADRWVVNALWGALSYDTSSIKDVDNSTSTFGLNLNPASVRLSLNYLF